MSFQEPNTITSFFINLNEKIIEFRNLTIQTGEGAGTLTDLLKLRTLDQPDITSQQIQLEINILRSQLKDIPPEITERRCQTFGFPEKREFCNDELLNGNEINTIKKFNENIESEIAQRERFIQTLSQAIIPIILPSEEIIIEDVIPVMDELEIITEKKDNTLRNVLLIGGALLLL